MKEKDSEIKLDGFGVLEEILNLPELQISRKALEGGMVIDIIKHALKRQYILGQLDVELGLDDNDIKDLDFNDLDFK